MAGRLRVFHYYGNRVVLEQEVNFGELVDALPPPEPWEIDITPWLQLEDNITNRAEQLGREIHLDFDFAHAVAERHFMLLANPIMWEAPDWFGC